MDESRIHKRIFIWSDRNAGRGYKNHIFCIKANFRKLGHERYSDISGVLSRDTLIYDIVENMTINFILDCHNAICNESGRSGTGRNKLRTYRLLKSEYKTESYCKLLLPSSHRAAFAKFRCGVANLRIETGRFENLDLNHRLCSVCNVVEKESHVILDCSLYNDQRHVLFSKAALILPNFYDLNNAEKMKCLLSHPDPNVCQNLF